MNSFAFGFFVFAFLEVSRLNPTGHWTMVPHILVVEVDGSEGQQTISCLEPGGDQSLDVLWKKNGVMETQRGNSYVVELMEGTGGGNYTCHRTDGSLLNHTEVLIQRADRKKILVKDDQEDYLKCFAPNYNGQFHCSWTWSRNYIGKVASIIARRGFDNSDTQCSVDTSGLNWTCSSGAGTFRCSVDDGGQGILCLDKQHCPYAEESQRVHITVYLRTVHYLVEHYSKAFYLSEIVKPDKVRISKVNRTMVEWTYPSTWSTPSSYFPLTFQIRQLKRRCRGCDNPCINTQAKTLKYKSTDSCQFEVKRKVKTVCVRAKDALCNSQWSEWSHLSLRGDKKNGRQKIQ